MMVMIIAVSTYLSSPIPSGNGGSSDVSTHALLHSSHRLTHSCSFTLHPAVLINQHWSRTSSIPAQKALQLLTVFFVSPLENQGEEVGEANLLYQVLETQSLYITLQFKTESSEEIGQVSALSQVEGLGEAREG